MALVAIVLLAWLLIQTEPVQNWIVKKVTTRLSKDLDTEVSIRHVSIALFNRMNLEGTLIRDKKKDTLLYADQLKVRITDWFFLKDELVLKYVGLDDAYINLYRRDSVWNYQFLIDHFTPEHPSPKPKKQLKLDLKKLDFKNVRFVQNDEWVGNRMEVNVGALQMEADLFDLEQKRINITQLDLDRPIFGMYDFDGIRPPRIKTKRKKGDTDLYFNAGDLHLTVNNINLKNGIFISENSDEPPLPYFDGSHIRFEKITGSLANVSFYKDTIKAGINLATKERSGFEVKKLQADFKLTPEIMEFANLDLVTPRSRLQHYYAMKYVDFNEDFKHYIADVTMEANFVNAELHSDDIAYFAPELKDLNHKVTLWGTGKGTVENLRANNVFIRVGAGTTLSGDLSIVGLPNIDQTYFHLTSGDLRTTYRDATSFVPEIATVDVPSLASVGNLQFRGNFSGTLRDFKTAGNFSTNLGAFSADVAMKIPVKAPPVYSGRIVTRQFNIGKFLVVKDMGNMAFNGQVQGVGLDLNSLRTTVTGNVEQLVYNNYPYRSIQVEGTFQRRQYEGTVKIDDPNLNVFTTVKMDFRQAQPRFNVLGDLASSNFTNLGFSNKQLEVSALFDLDFSGKNIDQFLGSIKIFNANLVRDSTRLNFDSLTLQSGFDEGRRLLAISSNEFDAQIEGYYNILDLPVNFQVFLYKYYPAYFAEPRRTPNDQQFTFVLNTRDVDGYAQLFDKDISGFTNSIVTGNINTPDTLFEINASVPAFSYQQYQFNGIDLQGKGDLDQLEINGEIGHINVSDSTIFPQTRFHIVSQQDVSKVSVQSKASNTLNELNLDADVHTYNDGVRLHFNPSDFVINDKRWTLEKEGELIIRRGFVSAENIRFTQGDQVIEAESLFDGEFDQNHLAVKLSNINIGDFAPLITTDPRLEGTASGEVLLKDFFGNFRIETNITAQQFRLDNDSVGVVVLKGLYNSNTGMIRYYIESENDLYNFLADGTYNLKDSIGQPLVIDVSLKDTRINFLNKFLNAVFTNVDGQASGDIRLYGNPNSPTIVGRVKVRDASLLVNFTQVAYTIDSATFNFYDNRIDFGRFTLKDKFGNSGTASGILYQRGFQDIHYDFDLSTQRMLLIDTKASDNDQFYGTAIGRATLTLNGPEENLHMYITAEPVDSSHIYIPTTTARESADADYIVFKQYGVEIEDITNRSATNIVVDLDLVANPLANIDVILDPLTGDIIEANGNGRLRIHAGTNDALTINGRYEITKGSYAFNFQSFIQKPFDLREGGFIEWNGDPYNARLVVEATYTADNVRLSDLIGMQDFGGSARSYNDKVFVVAEITGYLEQPTIDFRFEFPASGQQILNNPTFSQFLAKLEQDENEMLKQVTYLLVFGSFAPYGEGRNLQSNFTTLGYNTISEMVSKQVNRLVSNLLFEIFKDPSLQFDVSTSVYNSSSLFSGNVTATNNIDRSQVNFKLSKGLLNNNIIVTVGGDLDFRFGSTTGSAQQLSALQWLPDIAVEIILSKDRRIRAIVFSRNNIDISTGNAVGRRSRQGVSLSYRRDFETIIRPPKQIEEKPAARLPEATPETSRKD